MIARLIMLRLKIMLRQKFAWMSFVGGLTMIMVGYVFASTSFLAPHKLYYDFALGVSFVGLHLLALYQSVQLFYDEKDRRTLQLLLVSGVSRPRWIVGNVLGLWSAYVVIDFLWLLLTVFVGTLTWGDWGSPLLLQVKILQSFALLVVISLTLLMALFLRPALALALSFATVLFLNSVSSVENLFRDETIGHLMQDVWALKVLKLAKVLPPLEWFDLKVFVGYETSVSWFMVLGVSGLGILWSSLFIFCAGSRLKRLDL